jgi:hypothetical protein
MSMEGERRVFVLEAAMSTFYVEQEKGKQKAWSDGRLPFGQAAAVIAALSLLGWAIVIGLVLLLRVIV